MKARSQPNKFALLNGLSKPIAFFAYFDGDGEEPGNTAGPERSMGLISSDITPAAC